MFDSADIFVFPSLYEGFGIPPLEAMQHGTPVICSNTTSLPEVCGDAAYYINPCSEESIFNALVTLDSNTKLKNDLIKKGFENLKRFSWEKSAFRINEIVTSN